VVGGWGGAEPNPTNPPAATKPATQASRLGFGYCQPTNKCFYKINKTLAQRGLLSAAQARQKAKVIFIFHFLFLFFQNNK
jgi:hypothetical protein